MEGRSSQVSARPAGHRFIIDLSAHLIRVFFVANDYNSIYRMAM